MNEAQHQDAPLAAGSRLGERLKVVSLLGVGGMGDVYLAQNTEVRNLRQAVKMLRQEFSANEQFVAALRSEADKQAALVHDNVVQIVDFFEQAGRYCLVESYVPGETIAAKLEQPGATKGLPLESSLTLICEVLSGLNCAHENAILHCDIKPANIIVDKDGHAKITDFGIARDLRSHADADMMAAGTPEYMSPEQILTPAAIDHRTDVYSTGVMLFEMLCGHLPFEGSAHADGSLPQLRMPPPDIRTVNPDLPEDVARILLTAMQRERDLRFGGCGDFIAAIVAYRRRVAIRKWRPWIISAAFLVVAGGVGFWRWKVYLQERSWQEATTAGAASIADSAKSLTSMCREAREREVKRAGVAVVRQMNNPGLLEQFNQRLSQMDANVETLALSYAGSIHDVADLPAPYAARLKDMALKFVTHPEYGFATEFALSDYAARHSVPIPHTSAELMRRCDPPIVVAP